MQHLPALRCRSRTEEHRLHWVLVWDSRIYSSMAWCGFFFFLMSPHPRLYFMKQQCCHIHAGWTLWARHDSHTLREGENRQVVDPRLRNTAIHWPQTPASTCVSGNCNIFPSKPCCHMVFVCNSILRPKTRLRKPLCPTHTQKDITSIISINFERNSKNQISLIKTHNPSEKMLPNGSPFQCFKISCRNYVQTIR